MKMVFEGVSRKIDGTGRIVLPKNLRSKYRLAEGDSVDYYTCTIDGKDYICVAAAAENVPAAEEKKD